MNGRGGASSQTFWWRRCSEQSRVPRCTALPWPSPITWTSIWRGFFEVFLDIDGIIAEGRLGLGARGGEGDRHLLVVARHLHAASAAARRSLDHHRIADVLASACASAAVVTSPAEPGTTGMPSSTAVCLAVILSPMISIWCARRADEGDLVLGQDVGEPRVLAEKAVAWMHRVGAGDFAGGQDRGDVEVAVPRRRRPDADAFVGQPTCMALESAVECTATVAMPSSLQARRMRSAISPRLAMRTLENMVPLFDDDQRFAIFDRLRILDQDAGNGT